VTPACLALLSAFICSAVLADETSGDAFQAPKTTTNKKKDWPPLPTPTQANIHYGPGARQTLDFWKAESNVPTPVVFYIHGGGWNHGDKGSVASPDYGGVEAYLALGISVVSINYRYCSDAQSEGINPPVKGPLGDAARALQFVRSKAAEWNIDKTKIAATGGSAGGFTSLWLAFHNDLADPNSDDPVARESTRLFCAAVRSAQTSLDPKQMKEWIPNIKYGPHAFGFKPDYKKGLSSFDVFLAQRETILPWIEEYSPYALVTADDPPIFMAYSNTPKVGQDASNATHSASFGAKLQERCNEVGVPCELVHRSTPENERTTVFEYLVRKLKPDAPIVSKAATN